MRAVTVLGMPMRVGIELDAASEGALWAQAERESTDPASVVRRAVVEYLVRHRPDEMVDRVSRLVADLDAPILDRL